MDAHALRAWFLIVARLRSGRARWPVVGRRSWLRIGRVEVRTLRFWPLWVGRLGVRPLGVGPLGVGPLWFWPLWFWPLGFGRIGSLVGPVDEWLPVAAVAVRRWVEPRATDVERA